MDSNTNPNIVGCMFYLNAFIILGSIIIYIPIKIARTRGLKDSDLKTITILSFSGLLLGITWFVALALSLIYQPKKMADKADIKGKPQISSTEDLEKLLKLNELREKGIITQEEFENQKRNLLSM